MSHGDCAVFVVVVERWKRKVGGGWIVGFFFFFSVVGGCRLRSGGRGRLLWPGLCFFFPCAAVVCGCGWRGNGGGGRCCCDGLIFEAGVYHYFNEVFILL